MLTSLYDILESIFLNGLNSIRFKMFLDRNFFFRKHISCQFMHSTLFSWKCLNFVIPCTLESVTIEHHWTLQQRAPMVKLFSVTIIDDNPLQTEHRVNESRHPCSIKSLPFSQKVSLNKNEVVGTYILSCNLRTHTQFNAQMGREFTSRRWVSTSNIWHHNHFQLQQVEVEITTAINRSYSGCHTPEAWSAIWSVKIVVDR